MEYSRYFFFFIPFSFQLKGKKRKKNKHEKKNWKAFYCISDGVSVCVLFRSRTLELETTEKAQHIYFINCTTSVVMTNTFSHMQEQKWEILSSTKCIYFGSGN